MVIKLIVMYLLDKGLDELLAQRAQLVAELARKGLALRLGAQLVVGS